MFDLVVKETEKILTASWALTEIIFDDLDTVPKRGTSFIRPVLTQTVSEMISGTADSGLYREHGLLTVQVFTKARTGTVLNYEYARKLNDIFRNLNSGSLYFGVPYIRRIGEEKEWFQSHSLIPFYYDYCT